MTSKIVAAGQISKGVADVAGTTATVPNAKIFE
jgi:hypothetical protein